MISPKPEVCTIKNVKELLNHECVGLNENLLRQLFKKEDVLPIRKTPTSSMGISDIMVWILSKDRQYTVKSGYQMAKVCQKRAKRDE